MKKFTIIILLCILLLIGYYIYHSHQAPPAIPTVSVTRGDITEKAIAIGNIVPEHSITVKSQLAGTVKTLFHVAGDYVQAGDKLLEIQPNPTPQDYAAAIDAVSEDEAKLAAAQRVLKNYEYLLQRNLITSQYLQYLQAKQDVATYQANLQLHQQNLNLLKQGHAVIDGKPMQSIITSPVDGYILQKDVDVGDPVISLGQSQEATPLFSIANMKDLIFKGTVDENDASKLKVGMPADITVAALPSIKITGKISQLALQSNTQNAVDNANKGLANTDNTPSPFNNAFEVEINQIKLAQSTVQLRSGYSATASIITRTAHDVLLLPERVLIFKDNKTYVKLPDKNVNTSKTNPDGNLQAVTTGLSDGIQVEITSGLKEGQVVLDQ